MGAAASVKPNDMLPKELREVRDYAGIHAPFMDVADPYKTVAEAQKAGKSNGDIQRYIDGKKKVLESITREVAWGESPHDWFRNHLENVILDDIRYDFDEYSFGDEFDCGPYEAPVFPEYGEHSNITRLKRYIAFGKRDKFMQGKFNFFAKGHELKKSGDGDFFSVLASDDADGMDTRVPVDDMGDRIDDKGVFREFIFFRSSTDGFVAPVLNCPLAKENGDQKSPFPATMTLAECVEYQKEGELWDTELCLPKAKLYMSILENFTKKYKGSKNSNEFEMREVTLRGWLAQATKDPKKHFDGLMRYLLPLFAADKNRPIQSVAPKFANYKFDKINPKNLENWIVARVSALGLKAGADVCVVPEGVKALRVGVWDEDDRGNLKFKYTPLACKKGVPQGALGAWWKEELARKEGVWSDKYNMFVDPSTGFPEGAMEDGSLLLNGDGRGLPWNPSMGKFPGWGARRIP